MQDHEKFAVLKLEMDGLPLIANINADLPSPGVQRAHAWFLSLSSPLLNPTSEGLPSRSEADDLNSWEDTVEAEIASAASSIFGGRVTWNGHRELLYYLNHPERAVVALQVLIDSRRTRPFAFRCEQDLEWRNIKFYLQ
jgi:hypothetical protein